MYRVLFRIPNCRIDATVPLAGGIPYCLDKALRGIIGGRMSCQMRARLHSARLISASSWVRDVNCHKREVMNSVFFDRAN
jgi:hypothetical protein